MYCLVARDETEWTELVDLEYNFLVGASREAILAKSHELKFLFRPFDARPYGNGDAAIRIARLLKESYQL